MVLHALGIDAGVTGALALIRDDPLDIVVHDLASHTLKIGGKNRSRLDLHAVWAQISGFAAIGLDLAVLEETQSFGQRGPGVGQSGPSPGTMHTLGKTSGALEAFVVAAGIPYRLSPPREWKKALGIPTDKEAARLHASRLFPAFAHLWSRKKDHNRAEAVLIARFALLVLSRREGTHNKSPNPDQCGVAAL